MRAASIIAGREIRTILAVAATLVAFTAQAPAQIFNLQPLRPPADVPVAPPPQDLMPPPLDTSPPARGPSLQSLPPPTRAAPPPTQRAAPSGNTLMVAARYGPNLQQITNGLHWRVFPAKPNPGEVYRPIKEERSATPVFTLPPGTYVVHVGFGLATAVRAVQVRAETTRELFDIPAGGVRIQGRVGDAPIPAGQIWFDLYRGSQFEPGNRRPIAQAVAAGDLIHVEEGNYHVVSNYGDGNSLVRSDIRVVAGKLIDATVTHRAAIITLKLVSQLGGEARANTQWSVLTPGGDVVKESIGAFPRVILAEGDYRAIARNDDRTYERTFKVVTGVDGVVEVLAR
jgi:hypothetical protein